MTRLCDLGERRILSALLPRFTISGGNDCEIVPITSGSLVITTDPVPPPAARTIAQRDDPYYAGWLLVTINASDIAAAGADPIGIMVAAEFPADERVSRFERFLEGIRDACQAEGHAYLGGNLREASIFAATGTAVGWRPADVHLGRKGACAGDIIVLVGQGGVFWRDAFRAWRGAPVEDSSPLYKPLSQSGIMRTLARSGLLTSAMDNSDGLLPTLAELAGKNATSAVIELERLTVPEVESDAAVAPWKLWLGWGDWTVIATVAPRNLELLLISANDHGGHVIPIGQLVEGDGAVLLADGHGCRPAGRLESERFVPDSWFSSGIGTYAERLRSFGDEGDF